MSDPTQGPYTVEAFEIKRTMKSQIYFRVVGPTPTGLHSTTQKYAANRLCDRLNAAYKQGQQDRWIPVAERLPEEGEYEMSEMVLCQTHKEGMAVLSYSYRYKQWRAWNGDEWPEATHWMPLPSPPNPEQR